MGSDPKPCITIEAMTAETVEAVAALEQECFANPWSLDGLVEELSNPLAVFRVAFAEGQAAGYVGMHHILDEGYITNIAVGEAHRRTGVATALMRDLMAYAAKHKMSMVTLEVRPSNKAALELYSRFDFREEGRRRDFYRNPTEDALILTCGSFSKKIRPPHMLAVL